VRHFEELDGVFDLILFTAAVIFLLTATHEFMAVYEKMMAMFIV
jgi:hypothetical protein